MLQRRFAKTGICSPTVRPRALNYLGQLKDIDNFSFSISVKSERSYYFHEFVALFSLLNVRRLSSEVLFLNRINLEDSFRFFSDTKESHLNMRQSHTMHTKAEGNENIYHDNPITPYSHIQCRRSLSMAAVCMLTMTSPFFLSPSSEKQNKARLFFLLTLFRFSHDGLREKGTACCLGSITSRCSGK